MANYAINYDPQSTYNYPTAATPTFYELWSNPQALITDYAANGLKGAITDQTLTKLWWLLYGRHGNDGIRGSDVARWKAELFTIVFVHGPAWERKLAIQDELKNLTDDELRATNVHINNQAVNPSTAPSTNAFDPLTYINNQTASGGQRNKMDALTMQAQVLDGDFTEEFLSRFDRLFAILPASQPTVFWTEEQK